MTKDQMQKECDRLQARLEAYEARALTTSIPDDHKGLRQRLAVLQAKLADPDRS